MKIQFLGATQTVTGSKYLIQTEQMKILVDCGLFQGYKELRLRNWSPIPINPSTIDYVLLTHAHIDHSGYIPLLVKNGFRGKIICTSATKDLCTILLPDSGHLQEEEANYANQKGYSKHHPALPLYTQEDAETALSYFHTVELNTPFQLHDEFSATFHYAGHILGASLIQLRHKDASVLFSGDLGRPQDPIMNPPQDPPESDYLVIESTYGNRLHDPSDPQIKLGEIINRTVNRGGMVLIPAFAVGRTQTLLYYIQQLKAKKAIPDIPVYVDSPMASNATQIFSRHSNENRLSPQQCTDVCEVAQYIRTVDESIALGKQKMPMILISASGMATGGRVVHHIRNFAPYEKNTILFSGFQAGGTRGDRLVRGEKEIKMFGQMVPINAEISQLENASAHADYAEMLTWLAHLKKAPRKIFITHGEMEAATALKLKIEQKFNWNCMIPNYLDQEILGDAGT
ncbi:MBL fold metallo-hydrolase RNA specificity domain-containing protein [Legionella maioricensis]|uniref:MBL fold metallo-hydrolase n=1 Tax=Legionella maioricensis TaxID=2896528 RepID=A0A9X2IE52_9GAMM|nr:MBL fold metallo-hydrolase [Legionella maioricensis]MCL9685478.1 MBL fold metallo-hydrolase [Legionella maioricensis]MCL9688814.1 MBL fold metallo-hydrolase [Legionella maioricensis]